MATVVALDSSPANVLRSMRGPIVDARTAYPDLGLGHDHGGKGMGEGAEASAIARCGSAA